MYAWPRRSFPLLKVAAQVLTAAALFASSAQPQIRDPLEVQKGRDAKLLKRVGDPSNATQKFTRRHRLPDSVDSQHQRPLVRNAVDSAQQFFRKCREGHGVNKEQYRTKLGGCNETSS